MNKEDRPTVINDAKDTVLGRFSSYAAKQALLGKNVIIVNCTDAILTGRVGMTIEEYRILRAKGGSSLKGPKIPTKEAFRFVKRTVRGMLSHKQTRGYEAFKRVMCYNDTPKEYESAKKVSFVRTIKTKQIKVSELMRRI